MKENNKPFKLSVIIPTYNEALTIIQILEKIIEAELPNEIEKEIWVIDDCSTDDTEKRTEGFIALHPEISIKFLKLKKNRGKGYAVRTGIGHATGDIIIIQDADLEYDPNDYSALLQPILSGEYQVVYGSRLLNKGNRYSSRIFYWGGKFISLVTSWLFGHRITDEPTCYKMFDAALLKSIPLTYNRFGFCPEITSKLLKKGYKIKEVPISYYPRSHKEGKKIKWQDGLEAVIILIKNRFAPQSPVMCAQWLVKNIVLLFIAILVVHYTFSKQSGYNWVYTSLLKANMEQIKKYPELTFDEKMTMKLGASYQYLLFIKENTEENAVILYPSAAAFQKEGSPFTHEIYNRIYATRFLHPRKLIYEEELGTSVFSNRLTHIAIVNGVGYKRINFPLDSTVQHTIIPCR